MVSEMPSPRSRRRPSVRGYAASGAAAVLLGVGVLNFGRIVPHAPIAVLATAAFLIGLGGVLIAVAAWRGARVDGPPARWTRR